MKSKIRFGIIGLGHRGYTFAKNIIEPHPEAEVAFLCDPNDRYFSKFPYAKKTKDYGEVLSDQTIDAVFIATPDQFHWEVIRQAIQQNKHILCEKPLEVEEEKIRELVSAGKNYDKVIQVGYVLRYDPMYRRMKNLLAQGVIGEVIMADVKDHISYGGYAFFHDWHRQRKNSRSLLLQKGTHSLDLLNWCMGAEPTRVFGLGSLDVMGKPGALKKFGSEISDQLNCRDCDIKEHCEESIQFIEQEKGIKWGDNWPDKCVFQSEVDVDDNQSLLIQYGNNRKANYQLCQFAPFYQREFHFFGTEGELYFEDRSNTIRISERKKREERILPDYHKEREYPSRDTSLLNEFIQSINTQEKPVSNLRSAATVALLAIAAQRSIDCGTVEPINPL